MKSRMKLLGLVSVLVMATICTPAASAGELYSPWGNGQDPVSWTDISTWANFNFGVWEDATVLPTSEDWTYISNTSPTISLTIEAGDTGVVDYIYLGDGATGDPGDRLDVYGTLDTTGGPVYRSINFGNFFLYDPDPAILTVHDGGMVKADSINTYNLNNAHTDYMVQDGGTVEVDYIWSNSWDLHPGRLAYELNGGTFNLDGNYVGSAWDAGSTSDYLTIDIAGGTLVIGEDSFNADVTGGVILAEGVTVTEGNIGSLLDVSVTEGIATVTLMSAESADFDGDGDVDGNDFLVWQRGDANSADLALWQDQFGDTSAVAAVGSVPEPASIVLLGLGSLLVLGTRQRLNNL